MTIRLPDLPFPYHSLAPHMSEETLRYHHDKHHGGYVDKLNNLLAESNLSGLELEEIIQQTSGDKDRVGIFNNAAQCWNHTFFWNCMSPDGGGAPNGDLARQIDEDLGGLGAFQENFQAAAVKQFGSGWAWLVADGGRLKITTTPNAVPPMIFGQQPLLTCDVWEHAYYLDYQNQRAKFVETFLEKLVNWSFVAEQFMHQRNAEHAEFRRTGTD
jgi:Fe-Mn family superoxide dismutase